MTTPNLVFIRCEDVNLLASMRHHVWASEKSADGDWGSTPAYPVGFYDAVLKNVRPFWLAFDDYDSAGAFLSDFVRDGGKVLYNNGLVQGFTPTAMHRPRQFATVLERQRNNYMIPAQDSQDPKEHTNSQTPKRPGAIDLEALGAVVMLGEDIPTRGHEWSRDGKVWRQNSTYLLPASGDLYLVRPRTAISFKPGDEVIFSAPGLIRPQDKLTLVVKLDEDHWVGQTPEGHFRILTTDHLTLVIPPL